MNMTRKIFSVCAAMVLNSLLTGCGGGTDAVISYSAPASIIMTVAPTLIKKATTVSGGNGAVIHLYQALYGMAPSNALLLDYAFQSNNDASTFAGNLTDRFAATSHADLAKLVVDNLGVTATTVPAINAKGESEYASLLDAVKQLFAAYPTMRGQVIFNMTNLLAALESDITYGKAAAAYNGQARSNLAFSSNTANSNTTASSSQDVACSVQQNNYGDVAYPSEYLGAFPIPMPAGRLPTAVARGISFKDDWPHQGSALTPLTGSDCTDLALHRKNIFVETLNRIQQDGANQVWFYNASNWNVSLQKYHTQFTDDDIRSAVDAANKRNIKLFYVVQPIVAYVKGENGATFENVLFDNISVIDMKIFLNAYHSHIVERARFGEQIGLGGIQADCSCWITLNDPVLKEMWLVELSSIIDDIRKVFSGTIVVGETMQEINSNIAAKADALGILLWINLDQTLAAEENRSLTVNLIKAKWLEVIQQRYSAVSSRLNGASVTVPVLWHIQVQSRDDFFVRGWTEDGYCVSNCIQRTYKTDYSVQAIGVEAVLEAVNTQTYFRNYGVNFHTGFWLDDEMTPRASDDTEFPNLSQSIRNKPAENIVKYWFGH